LLHLIGLFNTDDFFKNLFDYFSAITNSGFATIPDTIKSTQMPSNFVYGLHDLRIKLPLLALPLIYGTSVSLTKKEFKIILQLFIATVLVSSFITTYVLIGFSKIELVDSRYASLFISHIRFALMVVLSIYILINFIYFDKNPLPKWEKWSYQVSIVWLICFLVLLNSFTGIVIFAALLPVTIIWWSYYRKKANLIRKAYISSGVIVLLIIAYSLYAYLRYNTIHDLPDENLESLTLNGNQYIHNQNSTEYENGYQIWIYVCSEEMERAWNSRSDYEYKSNDQKGQQIKITLIRYLTSLGYRKDSVGISKLDEVDIRMIEKGYTNYLFKKKFALYPRIYELLWEIDQYKKGGDPSGHSLAQRIVYLETGIRIIKQHFWFGTGTGDVSDAFHQQYEIDKTNLQPRWRLRAHNQFITFLLTFGIFGFLWLLFALFMPPYIIGRYKNYLFTVFFLIGLLSMLNEDTVETHVGVSFFAFFYSFFLFSMPAYYSSVNEKIK
jgi:O-antigen ligase